MSRLLCARPVRRCVFARIVFVCSTLAPAAVPGAGSAALALDEAVALALAEQPQIQAWVAAARTARETAVAERELPDPRLSLSLANVPVAGAEAFRLDAEPMTQVMVGVNQQFPRGRTRALRGERLLREAEAAEVAAEAARREVRREVALAWLEVFGAERAQALAEERAAELSRLAAVAAIAFEAGRAGQDELLEAQVAVAQAAEDAAARRSQVRQARSRLSRWIDAAAERPVAGEWPALPDPPALSALLEQARRHPRLEALARRVEAAMSDIALAEDGYRPGWGLEVYYANRPDFSDMVGVRVELDLPLFTTRRQDRRLAASRFSREEAAARHQDAERALLAQIRELWAERAELQTRLQRFDETLVPLARRRVDAARVAYEAGAGAARAVYASRSALLEAELDRLDLAVALAGTAVRFQYFVE